MKVSQIYIKGGMFLAYLPYFEKINEGLLDHLAVCVSVCVSPQLLKAPIVVGNGSVNTVLRSVR
jgi:hypothetical protein